jgi:hypothetical protein
VLTVRQVKNMICAICMICCWLCPWTLLAGQDVRIFVESDDQGTVESRSSALSRALTQGVYQEAEVLLGAALGEPRSSLLHEVLEPRAEEYVLGWEEIEYLPTEWGAVLHLDVRVNRGALRDFLQSLGTYYTADSYIGYTLHAVNLSVNDLGMVRNMETLSGLQNDGTDSLVLGLGRFGDGLWRGTLDFEGQVWTVEAQDLSTVWVGLWSNYFKLDRVRQMFEDDLILVTQGWASAGDIHAFDRMVRGWELQADKVELLGMSWQSDGLGARWKIGTMDREGILSKLRQYLRDNGIVFSIE